MLRGTSESLVGPICDCDSKLREIFRSKACPIHGSEENARRLRRLEADRSRTIRLFNRLEAAVSHHKKAHDSGRYFADDPDEALWKAREKILTDYAEGKG